MLKLYQNIFFAGTTKFVKYLYCKIKSLYADVIEIFLYKNKAVVI